MRRALITLFALAALLGGFTASASAKVGDYESSFVSAGKDYGINPNLLKAIAYRESGITNDGCNPSGYGGVMQVSCSISGWSDPNVNIYAGAREFDSCMRARKENVVEALSCYNAGLGRSLQIDYGTLASHSVTVNLPVYGRQTGKVPAWVPCDSGGFNDVCGYVHFVVEHFIWYQHATPYNGSAVSAPQPTKYAFAVRHPRPEKLKEGGVASGKSSGQQWLILVLAAAILWVTRRLWLYWLWWIWEVFSPDRDEPEFEELNHKPPDPSREVLK